MDAPVIGLVPTLPVIAEADTLVTPALERIAKLPAVPNITPAGPTPVGAPGTGSTDPGGNTTGVGASGEDGDVAGELPGAPVTGFVCELPKNHLDALFPAL